MKHEPSHEDLRKIDSEIEHALSLSTLCSFSEIEAAINNLFSFVQKFKLPSAIILRIYNALEHLLDLQREKMLDTREKMLDAVAVAHTDAEEEERRLTPPPPSTSAPMPPI